MDDTMKQFQESLIEIETEAENLLLARHQMIENDRVRNGNREALTALRKRARTTKTSVPSPFESIMKEIEGTGSKPLVKEVCATCGNHDSMEKTWMMFSGTNIFARIPFHAAHTILEKDQGRLDYDVNKLQSFVKEKSFLINEKGALADKISPGVLRSLVTLTDKANLTSLPSRGSSKHQLLSGKEKMEGGTEPIMIIMSYIFSSCYLPKNLSAHVRDHLKLSHINLAFEND